MTGKQPFEAIVARHGARVLRVCRAVVGPTDADDAWSETFLTAMRAYPELAADANVEAWLVTIAHRKGIDVLRAAARRATPVADVAEDATSSAQESSVIDPDLVGALAALTERQRAAVAYHYLGALSYVEVAAIVGGTPAAARRAAADGIAALRQNRHLTDWATPIARRGATT